MYINDTPMANTAATKPLEALKVGVAYLLQFMEPEEMLQALLQLAAIKGLPIDHADLSSLLETKDETPEDVIRTG